MKNKDSLFNKVEAKTNVSKNDILSLAKGLQGKDLTNEDNLRNLIKDISKLAGRDVSKEKEEKIINLVKNNKVPKDIDKLI